MKKILNAVGNTPLVELRRLAPPGAARILLKLESHNPTGSLKDRMAISVVSRALADGRLTKRGRLVEYTGGSTGTSLAFACAAHGIASTMVSSDAFSIEKLDHMRALGATVEVIPSEGGKITRELIRAMMDRAAKLCEAPGAFAADQFNNPDATVGYRPLAEEILAQCDSQVDAFVHAVGTAHSLLGTAEVLREANPEIRVIGVEPAESPVLSGGNPGAHQIEGIGPGFVPPIWDPNLVDGIVAIPTAEAMAISRRLAREEAILGGTSSGANVAVAIQEAQRLGAGKTVVCLICDSGIKYLSTELYRGG